MKHGLYTDEHGTQFWYQMDKLHRIDGPAVIFSHGRSEWYQNGKPHREDGPAVIDATGNKYWYHWGELHRFDGPAIEIKNSNHLWYLNHTNYTYEDWLEKRKPHLIQQNIKTLL